MSENWNESFVNWNSLPLYDKNDYIILPTSDFPNQDYLNINITKFAKFWYENPSKNFGALLKLRNEILYSSLKFSSSDHPNPLFRPKLTICFRTNTDTHDPQQEASTNEAIVFSNDFEITELIDNELEVFDISGKKVCTILRNPLGQTKGLSLLVSGSYIGMIKNKMHVKYIRLIRY
ncbi:MAG TPA: DNRLRE domain-containing protein [Saprospiraceae bacterium]|nr:DNRLRE domain-containing protein [Saprospiraceae bacterium]HMX88221.1 DNRLRE domain-containing protein [Saprospiraceae bacterium]HMZ41048.1 DNRLRE domain-containing protein [Saprospiraceae bacterium]HNA64249.1 DNRLRE domain-containing protein [Saprospiraceae bacterium]HNB31124.1 DNRLRE domain-containing protein [Saprospiraceae bacterium]